MTKMPSVTMWMSSNHVVHIMLLATWYNAMTTMAGEMAVTTMTIERLLVLLLFLLHLK